MKDKLSSKRNGWQSRKNSTVVFWKDGVLAGEIWPGSRWVVWAGNSILVSASFTRRYQAKRWIECQLAKTNGLIAERFSGDL